MIRDNQNKFRSLREQYNVFIYERFDYVINKKDLQVKYTFHLSDKVSFYPEFTLIFPKDFSGKLLTPILENIVFHIGMVELVSYWKAACPPNVVIKPYQLNKEQIEFWKKLYFHGLGEFFYLNGIDANPDDFMNMECYGKEAVTTHNLNVDASNVIVPVGGGKDSIVTLELLKHAFQVTPFTVNPRKATRESIRIAGFEEDRGFRILRSIHPELLKLNDQGFLNGHTPFSALLAFMSMLVASYCGVKYIALSNESSANEPTVVDGPNHQYSKSLEFETDFRKYAKSYITPDIVYFSFLRPLSEYHIASLFSGFSAHFGSFRSCNAGSKTDSWCGACPKCLFTAIILLPFVGLKGIREMIGKNILENKELIPILDELCGIAEVKPFECVGTVREVNLALANFLSNQTGDELPALIDYYKGTTIYQENRNLDVGAESKLAEEHFLPDVFLRVLKNA